MARTQLGNNNAYCQDNEISWIHWDIDDRAEDLQQFTQFLIRFYHQHPVLRRRHYFQGRKIRGSEVKDLTWYRPDGGEMTEDDWLNPYVHTLGLRLAGDAIAEVDPRGRRILDDTLLILLNAYWEPVDFIVPDHPGSAAWEVVFDTREAVPKPGRRVQDLTPYSMEPRSLAVLCVPKEVSRARRRAAAQEEAAKV